MKRILLGLLMVALGITVAAVPAQALSLPGCFEGQFLAYADKVLALEHGATNVTGNFLLRNPTGTLRVGAHNIINGTVRANRIFLGTGSVVSNCIANVIDGPGTCTTSTEGPGSFVLPAECTFPPLPVAVFPAVCSPGGDLVVAVSGAITPGCYNKVRINANVEATIAAGQTVFTKTEFRQLNGSSLASGTPGSKANVVAKTLYVTEPGAVLTDLFITSLGGPGNNFHIGNGSIVENTVAFSPNGEVHLHTGSQLRGDSELIAVALQLEPFTNTPPPTEIACVCPPGSVLKDGVIAPNICVLE